MNTEPASDLSREKRLGLVVEEFHAALDRGEHPDPAEWTARHPDLAPDLEATLASLTLRPTAVSPQPCQHEAAHDGEQPTVAYIPDDETQTVAGGPPRKAPPTPLARPDRLGDYEILEPLDAGGEGMVFRARHRLNDHIVALKMIRPGLVRNEEAVQRLRAEARAIASLRHDNIVPIHFVGEDGGTWYFTMPLMPGGSLKGHHDWAAHDLKAAGRLLEQVARGIHHAHTRGVLHLDLKPANVLLDDLGRPYVTDFGLALRLETGESPAANAAEPEARAPGADAARTASLPSPQIRGTAPYMAPEVASGKLATFSTAADIYGLGALLYTLVTGRPPFEGKSLFHTLKRVTTEEPVPPRVLNRHVDSELQAVCMKCLMKEPTERYGSADALANDVARWLRGEPTLAGRPSWSKRTLFAVRRHPWVLALTVLGAAALALAAQAGSLEAIHASGSRDAHRLAGYMTKELNIVGRVLIDASDEPELVHALRDLPPNSEDQRESLLEFLNDKTEDFETWFGLGQGSPLVNLFIVDAQGVLQADTGPGGAAMGRSFTERDYFRHFFPNPGPTTIQAGTPMAKAAARPRPLDLSVVHVSPIFHSIKDGRFKMAVGVPIIVGQQALGVLVANLTLGSQLGMVDLTEELAGVSVIAPMDWSYGEEEAIPRNERHPFAIAFDRRYGDSEEPTPIWVRTSEAPRLAEFVAHPELRIAHDYGYRGCALHYERVGESPLVVVIRQPYPWPAFVFSDSRLRPILVVIGLLGLAALGWPLIQRARLSRTAETPAARP